ncbi:MAG: DUF5680 domain-containing protein [Candidatus Tectomicrobia bacterium]|nr:DUF5680 domain-containing protein [Candidatus Tectomicrobia bacterium]
MRLPCEREEFIRFLVHAKRQTYASQGDDAMVAPLLPGTRQLEYRDRAFFYRDVYVGTAAFVGQEIVYYQDQPIWSMSYAGGLAGHLDAAQALRPISAFLRTALRQVSEQYPYRGPHHVEEAPCRYTHQHHGSFEAFWGVERITQHDEEVYTLHYSGCLL